LVGVVGFGFERNTPEWRSAPLGQSKLSNIGGLVSAGQQHSGDRRAAFGIVFAGSRSSQSGWSADMPIALDHESDNTYRLDIRGLLRRAELAKCEDDLSKELDRVGSARLLCVLTDFQGWEQHADWNDLGFYVKYGDAIERIAIVGDERWRDLTMMFANADLRRAPVEFFPEHEMARARTWLSSRDHRP
jgi:SpoIIAA-like